jgi:hypothetical protein
MLGNYMADRRQDQYLFFTKGNEIKDHFKLHTKTLAIKKIVLKEAKLIISLGYDLIPEEDEDFQTSINVDLDVIGIANKRKVIKIWNYSNLIMGDYEDYIKCGVTGGYLPGPHAPRIIEIQENSDSPPIDFFDISPWGEYLGVITSRVEITVYRAIPNFAISGDKGIKSRPVKLGLKKSGSQILSLFFYNDSVTAGKYIYIVSSEMVYLMNIERKTSEIKELTMADIGVVPGWVDLNIDNGNLLVSQTYPSDKDIPSVGEAIYNLENEPVIKFCSEGNRVFSKLYGKLFVIVTEKEDAKRHHLEVYDTSVGISFYSKDFQTVHDIIVDNNAIFLFVTHSTVNQMADKELIKLTEITVGEKIRILLEKHMYKEAERVAVNAEWSEEIKAAVAKAQGDHLYASRKYKESMDEYIKTIGFEAPSYVIEKFLEVQNLDLLILYLEKLIDTPITKNNNLLGNNKDYTALLLNCYLKQQKKDKIEEQMIKDRGSDSIFEVQTAIDVCRQKPGYSDLAIKLAQRYEKWELLVSIYIEDEKPNLSKAITIIDENIRDVKSKVKMLQQYGSQLLNTKADRRQLEETGAKHGKEKKAYDLLVKITKFLILRAKNPNFSSPEYENYDLDQKKNIKLSEMIKIFVDRNDLLADFLKEIIDRHSDDALKICGNDLHIYHKLLEWYLNIYAENKNLKLSDNMKSIEKDIEKFIKTYEARIDKDYVLYLFRFYNYLDGIKKLAQQLQMNQELLSVYMEKKE